MAEATYALVELIVHWADDRFPPWFAWPISILAILAFPAIIILGIWLGISLVL